MPDHNSDWMDLPTLDGKEDRLETALHRLLRNLTAGGMYRGNPYCNQDIKEAFEALHAEKASRKGTICLCGAPLLLDGQCSVKGCVCAY